MSKYPLGTLDFELVQNTIFDWIRLVSEGVIHEEESIIWRQQSEPLPPRPCVTMRFIYGPSPIARSANMHMNPGLPYVTMGMQYEATLSIQVYGNTRIHRPMAYQLGIDLVSSLMQQTVLDQLKQGGVSVQGLGRVQNVTALEESEYEERSALEIQLGLAQNVRDKPATIGTVNLSWEASEIEVTREIILP
jgi:hypothetical protein